MSDQFDATVIEQFADEADYAIVGPRDSRTRVLSTRATPYAAVCHLALDLGSRRSGCTGFLVSPSVIVTAAHCLRNRARLRRGGPLMPRRIDITPGRDGALMPFGRRRAQAWYVHRGYVRAPDVRFDVGILVVDRPFAGPTLPLVTASDAELDRIRRAQFVHIAGYPGDKPRGTQWEHTESLRQVQGRILRYSVDTCPGHSGSPVWRLGADGQAAAIGIHTGGPTAPDGRAWGCAPGVPVAPRGQTNRGVRATHELVAAVSSAAQRSQLTNFVLVHSAGRDLA